MLLSAVYGEEPDLLRWNALRRKVLDLNQTGRHAEAIPVAKEALEFAVRIGGEESESAVTSLVDLASAHAQSGVNPENAKALYDRAIRVCEKVYGPDDPKTGSALTSLGVFLLQQNQYVEAAPVFRRVLGIHEKAEDVPLIQGTLLILSKLLLLLSSYDEAEIIIQRVLCFQEAVLGSENQAVALSLSDLGAVYRYQAKYADAEDVLSRAYELSKRNVGEVHDDSATPLAILGTTFLEQEKNDQAEECFRKALKIFEKVHGEDHSSTLMALNNLGLVSRNRGQYLEAEQLLERVVAICEKGNRSNGTEFPLALGNLGEVYMERGKYAEAERRLKGALEICEGMFGEKQSFTAVALNNLATLSMTRGKFGEAERLFNRVILIYEAMHGPEHPALALALTNLGLCYSHQRKKTDAELCWRKALKILEKAYGENHSRTALVLNNLATNLSEQDRNKEAEQTLKRVIAVYERISGPDHPSLALALCNLGEVYHSQGRYEEAEPYFDRALASFEDGMRVIHPDTATFLNGLFRNRIDLGKQGVQELVVREQRVLEKALAEILSFSSEEGRMAFQETQTPFNLPATIGDAGLMAEAVLRWKGVVLDSLLEDRAVAWESVGAGFGRELEELGEIKAQLRKLILEVPSDLDETNWTKRAQLQKKLSEELESREGAMARRVTALGRTRRAMGVTGRQVASSLRSDEALVEWVRYNHYLGKGEWERRYGAVVFSPGKAQWIVLGRASAIEKAVKLYLKCVRGKTDDTTVEETLRGLYEQVWEPIRRSLPATVARVVLCPDALLNFVSFATLLDSDGRFLAESHRIRYVGSGRDLVRDLSPASLKLGSDPKMGGEVVIFGNPDFGAVQKMAEAGQSGEVESLDSVGEKGLRSAEIRDFSQVRFEALPGTGKECDALKRRGWPEGWAVAQPRTGRDAVESELMKVVSPKVLHLATHGFFLPEMELQVERGRMLVNRPDRELSRMTHPMHRSGLALAGAQRTMESWAQGNFPPFNRDGVLMAEEVGLLKLEGTWLVTLSACETGTGESRSGEGVLGLRRGFVQAGAENLLMTLWAVNDEATMQFMLEFYDRALESRNPAEALGAVQREWLVRVRGEKGLVAAVNLAGPFILSSVGPSQ